MLENMKVSDLLEIMKLFKNNSQESLLKKEDMRYVIVRTYSAGVFAGNIESRDGKEVVLRNARRLWAWSGAASLSQLATDGTKKPTECKFPCEVDRIEVLETIEILDVTSIAEKSIKAVEVWKQ